jgi:hypothetical protein
MGIWGIGPRRLAPNAFRSTVLASLGIALLMPGTALAQATPPSPSDKLMYHNDRARSGWNKQERALSPRTVAQGLKLLWSTPQLDSFGDTPPRLYAAPLYVHKLKMTGGDHAGKTFSVAFLATTTGYAYAVSTAASGGVAAGTILWRNRLTEAPCGKGTVGTMATPIIDLKNNRLYVTTCSDPQWEVHALDIRSGKEISGWPLNITADVMNRPGVNRNGSAKWLKEVQEEKIAATTDGRAFCRTPCYTQRGALNLSADGSKLYLAFGPDGIGWLVAVDTRTAQVSSAFSSIPGNEQEQGGMWASGGPSIDDQGRIHVSTGINLIPGRLRGVAAVCPDCENNWGQSILQFRDEREGLKLTGTYTPYNYCQAGKADIDIGSSGTIVFDLPKGSSRTERLVALVGGKQGNAYLLDRDNMPGGLTRRQPCSDDSSTDKSLLAPDIQPEYGKRGPINIYKPFSDDAGAYDQAKSRSTGAYFQDARGMTYVFATGSSKTGPNLTTDMPPSVARLKVVASPGQPAFMRIDQLEMTQTFKNPGSPVITSNGKKDAIVWVLDNNAPRTTNLYGAGAPKPVLYAFDALNLKLLWKSQVGELFPTGKYNEPTIVNGMALVGTDRLQAFGLASKGKK